MMIVLDAHQDLAPDGLALLEAGWRQGTADWALAYL